MGWGEVGNFGEQDGEMAGLSGGVGESGCFQAAGEQSERSPGATGALAFAREAPARCFLENMNIQLMQKDAWRCRRSFADN